MQTSDGSHVVTPEETQTAPVTPEPAAGGEEHPEGVHLPPSSIWPVTSAAGVGLVGLGVVTIWPFYVLGIIVMGYGLNGWVQELRHESH